MNMNEDLVEKSTIGEGADETWIVVTRLKLVRYDPERWEKHGSFCQTPKQSIAGIQWSDLDIKRRPIGFVAVDYLNPYGRSGFLQRLKQVENLKQAISRAYSAVKSILEQDEEILIEAFREEYGR